MNVRVFAVLVAAAAVAVGALLWPAAAALPGAATETRADARPARRRDPVEPPAPGFGEHVRTARPPAGRSTLRGPERPQVRFRYRAGAAVTAVPLLDADGRIYVTCHDGYLHALDRRGRLRYRRWLGPARPGSARAPAYAAALLGEAGRLFVGSDAGLLWVLEAATGRVLAHRDLGGPVDTVPVPAVGGGVLVSAGTTLWSLDAHLRPRFQYTVGGKLFTSPAVGPEGQLFVGGQDDLLHGLSAAGAVRFRFAAGGDIDSSPVASSEGVYFGADDGRAYALSRRGQLRWRTDLRGYVRAPVALGWYGELFALSFGPNPRLWALSRADGARLWAFPTGLTDSSEIGPSAAPLVDGGGDVYVGLHDGRMLSLSRHGRLRWQLQTPAAIVAGPALGPDTTLVFAGRDGVVYGLGESR